MSSNKEHNSDFENALFGRIFAFGNEVWKMKKKVGTQLCRVDSVGNISTRAAPDLNPTPMRKLVLGPICSAVNGLIFV